ncbi:MAG: DUF6778 family protein [Pseudomonadota bacterium]
MTRFMRFISITAVAASVSACSTFDPATRSAPLEVPGIQAVSPSFDVTELRVSVPRDLRVSEANVYYPIADIVWRGDPIGDRHVQVRDLMGEAMQRGTDQLEGVQPVSVEIDVTRFHSLTEKARYSVGGVHSIKFNMTVRDATTGAIIVPTRLVNADLSALGGRAAMEAERNGVTQKSRISNHLAHLIKQELSRPLMASGGEV